MRLSASELSIGYRDHLVGLGVDLALTAGEALVRATKRTSPSECDHRDSAEGGPGGDDQSCLEVARHPE
jgi:hypothetical protein